MTRPRPAFARLGALLLLGLLSDRFGTASPAGCPGEEDKRGADIFVTAQTALLRETASPNGKIIAKLPYAARVALLESADSYLHVEVPADSAALSAGGMRTGFLACQTTAVFSPDPTGSSDLLTAGRALARNPTFRPLAAAFIQRGVERLRAGGGPQPQAELLLGETAEALAADGGPFPQGLGIVGHGRSLDGKPRYVFAGNAFQRALDLTAKADPKTVPGLRERALAGLLRSRFPETSDSLTLLWQETAGWLELAEAAQTPAVLKPAAERLGTAALSLGRLLLAAGRLEDLSRVTERVRGVAQRVAALAPDGKDSARLAARAEILQAMRGDGGRPFPQECRRAGRDTQVIVRIDGEIGKLKLLVQTSDGKRTTPFLQRVAVPVLPVPGSLRVSPDGKSAAWVEVSKPSALLPIMVSLEKNEPAREIAFLSSGRPLQDRSLANVLASVSGFSSDSRRLGLAIQAWDETPGPSPRLSVVSAETGELLFETSKDTRQFKRLLQ